MKNNFTKLALLILTVIVIGTGFIWVKTHSGTRQNQTTPLPQTSQNTATSSSPNNNQSDLSLFNYNVLIADRGNNRIIEVAPNKQIVWEYDFNLPQAGLGADDAFFSKDGKSIIASMENYNLLEQIDYASKKVLWSYGTPGKSGSTQGFLHTPDDAYQLPNGDITVADIKNCRVIELNQAGQIVRQYGVAGHCGNSDGLLNLPNGDTPTADGSTLISNISGHYLIKLNPQWQKVFSMNLPIKYPSDPQLMKDGNILVADYSNPGKIVEVNSQGQAVWSYEGTGPNALNHPSLAIELPDGNILSNDDYNDRVVEIDKQTHQIIWQYGITGKPGKGPNQLNIPDGLDIIPTGEHPAPASSTANSSTPNSPTIYSVGQVSRHAGQYLNQTVEMSGYVLKVFSGYAIISDESSGNIGYYDLPITGFGNTSLKQGVKYVFTGTLVSGNLNAVNKNPDHLVLTTSPRESNQ